MEVRVQEQALDPWQEVQAYQSQHAELLGKFGATTMFVGTMRDFNQGKDVTEMRLEHYPGMTESHLQKVTSEALEKWDVLDVLVIHRVGLMRQGDPIVLVAAWSAHRADAFAACRYVIDELKTRAPFWKQESIPGGETRWVTPEQE